VKTEIVHFLGNTFTLDKYRDQRQISGSELVLTDFDEAEMGVQWVMNFLAAAQADNKSPAILSLRAREGTTLNLLRMYGELLQRRYLSRNQCCLHSQMCRSVLLTF